MKQNIGLSFRLNTCWASLNCSLAFSTSNLELPVLSTTAVQSRTASRACSLRTISSATVSSNVEKDCRSQWMTYNLSQSLTHPTPSTANIACALANTASLGCCFFLMIPIHTHPHAMEFTGFCLNAKSRSALWISWIWLRMKSASMSAASRKSLRRLRVLVRFAIGMLVW